MCQHHPGEEKKKKKSAEDMLCWREPFPKRSLSWPQGPKAIRLDVA